MDKLRSLTIAAAVAFALGACAQNETAPDEPTASTSGSTTTSSPSSTAQTTPDSTAGTMQTDPTQPQSPPGTPPSAGAPAGAVAIGLQVESSTGEALGTVVDIVADPATGAPLFAVISTGGQTTAIPHAAASTMVQGDALVVDRTRLANAPRVEQSDLHEPSADWTNAANDYWGQGEMRTASPEPDASSSEQSTEEPSPESKPRG